MTHPYHVHTPEQDAILHHAAADSGNLMIEALAGCGKTSTLEALESVQPAEPVLYLAFNKAIAKEAEKRMRATTQVRTFNGLGYRIWAAATGKKLVLDNRKTSTAIAEHIKALPRHLQGPLWADFSILSDAVSWAKTIGYIPPGHTYTERALASWDDVWNGVEGTPAEGTQALLDPLLLHSINLAYAGSIDYNDMIYMPTLFGGSFPLFPLTLVDEYQDLNPLNHVMIRKLTRNRRLIGVGDPYQNIYGFRGAVAAGMPSAVEAHSMTRLPLSHSFRCPEAIVRGVWWHVPHFRWVHPGGSTTVKVRHNLLDFEDGSVIICRNNAPLFALAMRLLSAGRSVTVSGSDIGARMIKHLRKLGDESLPAANAISAVDDWLAAHSESPSAADTAACMKVFLTYGTNLGQAIAYAEHLLKQTGTISLMTGHKSKGLEFASVYHLDPFLIGDSDQERNLKYVISTRSRDKYTEINSGRIEG